MNFILKRIAKEILPKGRTGPNSVLTLPIFYLKYAPFFWQCNAKIETSVKAFWKGNNIKMKVFWNRSFSKRARKRIIPFVKLVFRVFLFWLAKKIILFSLSHLSQWRNRHKKWRHFFQWSPFLQMQCRHVYLGSRK